MSLAQTLLKKVPQYTRNGRHLRAVLQHGTPRKLANLARAEMERKQHKIECKSSPYLLIIDPCNYCNLKCPLCPTGLNDLVAIECAGPVHDDGGRDAPRSPGARH